MYYKFTLLELPIGISFISVLIHKNSDNTVIITITTILVSHQEAEDGALQLYTQHTMKCIKCTVNVKSKHCFVLLTVYHRQSALQQMCENIKQLEV